LANQKIGRDRPWLFHYPVETRYEAGPWLPRWVARMEGNQFLLRFLSYFRATDRPALVRWRHSVNERMVEVPFVLRSLEESDERILDVGCSQSILPLELAHLGFRVWGIDQRSYPVRHPNFAFVRCDVCQLSFPASFFDTVICLSTLEHVGLGFYGDTRHERGDLAAIRELSRVLKPGGKLILTTPYGRRGEGWQRVYDSAGIAELLAGLRIEKARYCVQAGDVWQETDERSLREIDSTDETRAVILIVARKP
jgi:SAM-dependent methyltransferase